ncbi:membrane protein insertase YidC [Thiolinea disciformis]|uniref:membrane protein insertase YidC n=1 Tax=Thiolinea disciformis TaxID=125614 RepID=UPI00035DC5B6|nr:membrane protein insertase YidC [Thiolinea disciformis]
MDSQRPFLYITLLFLGFLMWTTWKQDHAPAPPTPVQVTQTTNQNSAVPTATDTTTASPNTALPTASNVAAGQLIRVRTDVLDLQISTRGGDVVTADLPTYPVSLDQKDKPVRILDLTNRGYVAQSGLVHGAVQGQDVSQLAPSHTAEYKFEKTDYVLENGQNELIVPLTWTGSNGVVVTKAYRFQRGHFEVEVNHLVKNNSPTTWSALQYSQLQHGPAVTNRNLLTSGVQAYEGGAYYLDDKYTKLQYTNIKDLAAGTAKANGGWIAMLQHYFVGAWVPDQTQENYYYGNEFNENGTVFYRLGVKGPLLNVAAGGEGVFTSKLWVGPKLQDDLEKVAKGLDLTVDYGIFAVVSKPIFAVMKWIHGVVGNWGWTIILLTIFIKLLFFWPSAASYRSMAKMKAVAPRLKEITERFASDPQAKQKAMMDLYKKEKINPLGGCLPILIQIPVFMGLYWVLLESVELRQAPWILWYKDLSIKDPFYVLPLIMGATMFLQQKLNPPPADPMQQKIFQFLPVIFTVMFLFFPAGLVLYWVVNNALSIAQQWVINKKLLGHV